MKNRYALERGENMKKVLLIDCCDDCPHMEFYNIWNDLDDVFICEERSQPIDQKIDIGTTIDKGCRLKDPTAS